MKKILVIGSANADLVIRSPRVPALGETLVGEGFSIGAGGKGLNQAVAAKKLGGDVEFIGALGNDPNGQMLRSRLEGYGIEFKGVISDSVPTGCAVITVVGGDNFIVLDAGANALVTPEMIDSLKELIAEADTVMMQYEIPVESIIHAARIAKAGGTRVVVNPAPYKKMPDEFYSLVDILVPNEHEAHDLSGIYPADEESARRALEALRAKGTGTVIITMGSRGCVYNDGEETVFCPAIKTVAVDTTSAGDSFIGALCARLSNGDSLKDSVKYATKVSSVTVSRAGASDSIPYACEIEQ